MRWYFKMLSALGALLSSTALASAYSLQLGFTSTATGPYEEVIFNYSDPSGSFQIGNFSFASTSPSSTNLLNGSLFPTNTTQTLTGTGQFADIVSTTAGQSYNLSYVLSGTTSFPSSIQASVVPVSGVPLPASFPLFALALMLLGFVGWRSKRSNGLLAA